MWDFETAIKMFRQVATKNVFGIEDANLFLPMFPLPPVFALRLFGLQLTEVEVATSFWFLEELFRLWHKSDHSLWLGVHSVELLLESVLKLQLELVWPWQDFLAPAARLRIAQLQRPGLGDDWGRGSAAGLISASMFTISGLILSRYACLAKL